nr:MAG TPA: hypothetical protein [Caudoviricetes sp.]
MSEEILEKLIQFKKELYKFLEESHSYINSEDFGSLDDLNKDLTLTQFQTLQTLIRVLSIRIGINLGSVVKEKPVEESTQSKEDSDEQTDTAEGSK